VGDERSLEFDRLSLVRSLRQHLESLARAGLDRVPAAREPVGSRPLTAGTATTPPDKPAADASSLMPGERRKSEPAVTAQARPVVPAAASSPSAPAAAPASASAGGPLPPPSPSGLFGSSEFPNAPMPAANRPAALQVLAKEVAVCTRCPHLASTRTQTVFGTGNPNARLMFVGEAPGADEDRQGEPFVGRAGQLLNDMITKGMGLSRADVYIANVLKCRPPENRTPSAEEAHNCFPYLDQQIEIVRPAFLCLLGKAAVQAILNTNDSMGKMRGRWYRHRGIPTIVTYHPAYLLRTPAAKKEAWDDLRMLMKEMGLTVPSRTQGEGREP
jgi:DNA polymerase